MCVAIFNVHETKRGSNQYIIEFRGERASKKTIAEILQIFLSFDFEKSRLISEEGTTYNQTVIAVTQS